MRYDLAQSKLKHDAVDRNISVNLAQSREKKLVKIVTLLGNELGSVQSPKGLCVFINLWTSHEIWFISEWVERDADNRNISVNVDKA